MAKKTKKKKELDPEKDFKYLRPGHVDLGRTCDQLVKEAVRLLPGTGVLPARWKYVSLESFTSRYADLGPLTWAKTASYHMLIINGHHAFRIWTDTTDTTLCDIHDCLAPALEAGGLEVIDIPEASLKKTRPLTKRARLTTKKEVALLLVSTAAEMLV